MFARESGWTGSCRMFGTVFERSRRILLSSWLRWPRWRLVSARIRRCSACWIRLFCGSCQSVIQSELVIVRETGNHYGNSYGPNTISWPMFEDLRDNNQVFSGMFCRFPATVTIGYGDRAAQIPAELVSGSYFSILGVGAALGRTIAPDDDAVPDSRPVVVLSYSFWRSYFDGDRSIVGRTIALNSHAMTVIGVAQPGFDGVELGVPAKVFVPIMMKTEMTPHSDGLKDRRRRLSWVTAYGRLKPGVSMRAGATFAAAAHA